MAIPRPDSSSGSGLLNRKGVLICDGLRLAIRFSFFFIYRTLPKKCQSILINSLYTVIIPAYDFGRILRYNEMSLSYHSESLSHNTCVTWEIQATTAKLVLSGGIWRENSEGAMVVSSVSLWNLGSQGTAISVFQLHNRVKNYDVIRCLKIIKSIWLYEVVKLAWGWQSTKKNSFVLWHLPSYSHVDWWWRAAPPDWTRGNLVRKWLDSQIFRK